MSNDELEVVRSIFAAWNRRKSGREYMSPELEYVNPENAVETGTRTGPETFGRITDVYDWTFDRAEYHEVGKQIVVLADGHAHAKGSGVTAPFKQVYELTIENGLLVRFRWFDDPDEARAATGLSADSQPLGLDNPP